MIVQSPVITHLANDAAGVIGITRITKALKNMYFHYLLDRLFCALLFREIAKAQAPAPLLYRKQLFGGKECRKEQAPRFGSIEKERFLEVSAEK